MQSSILKYINKNILILNYLLKVINCQMLKTKFQQNLNFINNSTQQFEQFLSQIKTKHREPQTKSIEHQQENQKDKFSQISSQQSKKIENLANPQESYANKNDLKGNYRRSNEQKEISRLNKNNSNGNRFTIRNMEKMNPYPGQFFQQDRITKQATSQLIELKSVKELPSWLFDHIRSKNSDKLKNIYFKEDLLRRSQIMERSQSLRQDQVETNKSFFKQRYLNQPYIQKNQLLSVNTRKYVSDVLPQQGRERRPTNRSDQMRKASTSASFDLKSYRQQGLTMKKSVKPEKILINDYEYSYCPEDQEEGKSKPMKPHNNDSIFSGQNFARKYHSSQKAKSNNYRIRQEEKLKNTQPLPKFLTKRLPTVSEELPLYEPRKFQILNSSSNNPIF